MLNTLLNVFQDQSSDWSSRTKRPKYITPLSSWQAKLRDRCSYFNPSGSWQTIPFASLEFRKDQLKRFLTATGVFAQSFYDLLASK